MAMAERIRNLWAVTDGEYSDYSVLAVFEREEDARAAQLAGLGDDVTEIPYCPAGVLPQRVTVHIATATAYRKGKLTDVAVYLTSSSQWWLADNPAPKRPRVHENPWRNGAAINLVAQCASAALAEKALRDRLAHIYAEWEGLT